MADKEKKKRGLGRGLSALMADVQETNTQAPVEGGKPTERLVPIEKIFPNPDQPRRHFDHDALQDLAASIAEKGVIQPLILRVRPGAPSEYEIVAGERRWRASQLAQRHEVPAIIREFDDTEVLEIAIIENIQREDLNPLEEALGFSQLMEKFGHTQEKLASALGKSRSHIANSVRLLSLPKEVQAFLRDGKLSSGHARALIKADDPVGLARLVVQKGLSVREVERMSKGSKPKSGGKSPATPTIRSQKDADTRALEGDLSANLGMRVSVDHTPGGESGKLVISYASLEDLDDLCRILSTNR